MHTAILDGNKVGEMPPKRKKRLVEKYGATSIGMRGKTQSVQKERAWRESSGCLMKFGKRLAKNARERSSFTWYMPEFSLASANQRPHRNAFPIA